MHLCTIFCLCLTLFIWYVLTHSQWVECLTLRGGADFLFRVMCLWGLLQRRQEKLNDQFTKIFSVRKQMTSESLVSKIQEIVPWLETFKREKFVFAFIIDFLLSKSSQTGKCLYLIQRIRAVRFKKEKAFKLKNVFIVQSNVGQILLIIIAFYRQWW